MKGRLLVVCDHQIRVSSCQRISALPMGQPDISKTRNGKSIDEQDFGIREESGAAALAMVVYHDAQDVRQGFDAGEATDAAGGTDLGQHRDGGRAWPEAESVVAVYSAREGADRRAHWVSVLSGH